MPPLFAREPINKCLCPPFSLGKLWTNERPCQMVIYLLINRSIIRSFYTVKFVKLLVGNKITVQKNEQGLRCAIYNTILLEMTHSVTHIEKIECINVLLYIRYLQARRSTVHKLNDMTPKEFVEGFYKEKQNLLKEYLSPDSQTEVSSLIKSMGLNKEQSDILERLLNSSFTDIFYTILLGLDGCTAIGGLIQQQFTVLDENNEQVCGEEHVGEVETLAYEYFHENEN